MSDSLRNSRLKHWLNELNSTASHLPIDGSAAADNDNESGYSSKNRFLSDDNQSLGPSILSLRSDWSKEAIINFKKLKESDPKKYQTWQRLQEERDRLQIEKQAFLADLSPDYFPSDDDQSSCPSVQTLRNVQSKGKDDFKEVEKSVPLLNRRWRSLQELEKPLQIQKESFLSHSSPELDICCLLLLWTLLAFSPYLYICCLLLLWTFLAFSSHLFPSDDDQSSCTSVQTLRSDWSNGKMIDSKESKKNDSIMNQAWQCLQEDRKSLRIQEEPFLAFSSHHFPSDDDQSSCTSVQTLRSDRSNGKMIDFKESKKNDPIMNQYWQSLQEERKRLQIQEEPFLAGLSPDYFPSDDDQSSCTSVQTLRSDRTNGKMINFKTLEKSNSPLYQYWQSLQEERKRLQTLEERLLADLPPDLFPSDDDQSSCTSVQTLRSDRSNGKMIDFKESKKNDPIMNQYWQSLQEERKRLQIQEEPFLAGLSPDYFPSDDDQSSCTSVQTLRSDRTNGKMINFKTLEKSNSPLYQYWQSLQEERKRLQTLEERLLADLPPDLIEELEEDEETKSMI